MNTVKEINFVVPPGLGEPYQQIVETIMNPVRSCLPNSKSCKQSLPDHVNVHFFQGAAYRQRVDIHQGINVFIPCSLGDPCYRDCCSLQDYDFVCISGPLCLDILRAHGILPAKTMITGFTKLDPFFRDGTSKSDLDADKPVVLYAPTHAAAESSSYPAFVPFLDLFPSDLRLIYSPHPVHKKNFRPTLQELADADVVISDCGSIVYEAWALGKPVVFPSWLCRPAMLYQQPESLLARIYRSQIGYHACRFSHLIDLVYVAVQEGMQEREKDLIDKLLPLEFRGHSGAATAAALVKLAG